jgi:hypothetical protein
MCQLMIKPPSRSLPIHWPWLYSSSSFLTQSPGLGNDTPGSGSRGPSDESHLKLFEEGASASDFCLCITYQNVDADDTVVDFFFKLVSTRCSSRCSFSRSAIRTSLFMALTLLLEERTTDARSSGTNSKVSLELRMSIVRVVGGTRRDPVEALRAIDRTEERWEAATDIVERGECATDATSSSAGASATFSSRESECELSKGASNRERLPSSSSCCSMTGSLRPYQLPAGMRIPGGSRSCGAEARCAARCSSSAFHFLGGKVE